MLETISNDDLVAATGRPCLQPHGSRLAREAKLREASDTMAARYVRIGLSITGARNWRVTTCPISGAPEARPAFRPSRRLIPEAMLAQHQPVRNQLVGFLEIRKPEYLFNVTISLGVFQLDQPGAADAMASAIESLPRLVSKKAAHFSSNGEIEILFARFELGAKTIKGRSACQIHAHVVVISDKYADWNSIKPVLDATFGRKTFVSEYDVNLKEYERIADYLLMKWEKDDFSNFSDSEFESVLLATWKKRGWCAYGPFAEFRRSLEGGWSGPCTHATYTPSRSVVKGDASSPYVFAASDPGCVRPSNWAAIVLVNAIRLMAERKKALDDAQKMEAEAQAKRDSAKDLACTAAARLAAAENALADAIVKLDSARSQIASATPSSPNLKQSLASAEAATRVASVAHASAKRDVDLTAAELDLAERALLDLACPLPPSSPSAPITVRAPPKSARPIFISTTRPNNRAGLFALAPTLVFLVAAPDAASACRQALTAMTTDPRATAKMEKIQAIWDERLLAYAPWDAMANRPGPLPVTAAAKARWDRFFRLAAAKHRRRTLLVSSPPP